RQPPGARHARLPRGGLHPALYADRRRLARPQRIRTDGGGRSRGGWAARALAPPSGRASLTDRPVAGVEGVGRFAGYAGILSGPRQDRRVRVRSGVPHRCAVRLVVASEGGPAATLAGVATFSPAAAAGSS